MSKENLGKPRPLWRVIVLSVATGMLYYGWNAPYRLFID
jgi:hypothetical protein